MESRLEGDWDWSRRDWRCGGDKKCQLPFPSCQLGWVEGGREGAGRGCLEQLEFCLFSGR